jgi:2-polyprenyl-3-methyl-5-hydroxy-6-metoxy-1,4-benzoquinol methylase
VLEEVEPLPRRVAGCDLSPRILETALLTAALAHVQPELVRANLEALPFEDGAFELVLCTQVVEHLLDPGAGIRELARVVAPGGTLLLSTDHSRNSVTRTLGAPRTALVKTLRVAGRRALVTFPERRFDRAEIEALVTDAGLELETVETFRFTPPPPFGPRSRRLLNTIEKRLPAHDRGDIVLVVARKTFVVVSSAGG